jgi:hypothetical protein
MEIPAYYRLVKARLPFLTEPDETEELQDLRLDTFYQLAKCFKLEGTDIEDITKYDRLQLMLVADIVAIKYLWGLSAKRLGASTSGANVPTFLKRAKAGSAEAEFSQVTGTGGGMSIDDLLDKLRASAMGQATGMGCVLDFLADPNAEVVLTFPFRTSGPPCAGSCELCTRPYLDDENNTQA